MSGRRSPWDDLRLRATTTPVARFDDDIVGGFPALAQRYLCTAIAAGTPLATAVRLEMRGHIKIGRWLPFRARQLLAPRHGTMWMATVAGVIRGSDRYVAGEGGMEWKLLGLVPFVRADGVDVTRSAAERAAGESIWAPTALAADPTTIWADGGAGHVDVGFEVDGHPVRLHHDIDSEGRLLHSHLLRWGDPENTGTWAEIPFGVEVTGHRTFGGVTIPNQGRAGWHFGTERWEDGVFFRFEITSYEPVRPA